MMFMFFWISTLLCIGILLSISETRSIFVNATNNFPALMGFFKFAILATMGELLGRRLSSSKWQIREMHIFERMFIWGFLGVIFSYVFPLYSGGVDFLISSKRIPVWEGWRFSYILISFWKSLFINLLFAFPFMTFHRITDTLIDQRLLFSKWHFLKIWNELDWDNMWQDVAPTIVWFWIPAHTVTFSLPQEYRILMAALLGICLGVILSFLKKKRSNTRCSVNTPSIFL